MHCAYRVWWILWKSLYLSHPLCNNNTMTRYMYANNILFCYQFPYFIAVVLLEFYFLKNNSFIVIICFLVISAFNISWSTRFSNSAPENPIIPQTRPTDVDDLWFYYKNIRSTAIVFIFQHSPIPILDLV